MAEFLILIYGDEQLWEQETEQDNLEKDAGHRAFVAAVAGGLRDGKQLAASSAATTLRARGGKPWATDGPFAESKEVLGGYYLIEVADRAEAVRLAGHAARADQAVLRCRGQTHPHVIEVDRDAVRVRDDDGFAGYVEQHGRHLVQVAYLLSDDLPLARSVVERTLSRAWLEWGRLGELPDPDATSSARS